MGAVDSTLSGAGTGAAIGSAIPGLGTVAGAAVGGLIGLAPSIVGLFHKNPPRPTISANPYTQMALDLAKQQAAIKGLTGGDILDNKLDNTTSNYVQGAQKSNNSMDFITGLASAMANKYSGQQNLAYEGAQEDKQNQQNLQTALGNSANDFNTDQEFNVEGGYQDQLGRSAASARGMQSFLGDLGTEGNSYLQGSQQNDFLNQMFHLGKYQRYPQLSAVNPNGGSLGGALNTNFLNTSIPAS
jgi:hypothetical protein